MTLSGIAVNVYSGYLNLCLSFFFFLFLFNLPLQVLSLKMHVEGT
jgi:hypothetical protein